MRLAIAVMLGGLLSGLALSGCDGTSSTRDEHSPAAGHVRRHFIAADPIRWDYAPAGRNLITGQPFDEAAKVFVHRAPDRIGSTYRKCLFRAYPDATFRTATSMSPSDAYLGLLGPVLRAEVGDTIEITFKNNCSFPTSLHPHGVRYGKDSEGAPYDDSTRRHAGDAVAPGATHRYTWQVPDRAGPGRMDGSSVAWMYHSHADEIGDVYAGLTGFLVVTARGKARADGSPRDVDREVFSLFEVGNENASPLLQANLANVRPAGDDEGFEESNLMHGINGYVYGNGPTVQLAADSRVRWYLMSMGSEVDLHTPHWHGNTAVVNGMRTDVVSLLPATMATADMTPDAIGTWLFHCHVGDHIAAGMQALYTVTART